MKAFFYPLIISLVYLIGCSSETGNKKQKAESNQKDPLIHEGDSLKINLATELNFLRTGEYQFLFSANEVKYYQEGGAFVLEEIHKTMKGQDAFYKMESRIRTYDISEPGKHTLKWDSTFKHEISENFYSPFLYTISPACCASEDGYTIRDINTGKAVVKYTHLINLGEFDFQLGYNAARAMNFRLRSWHPVAGDVFTFNGKVLSSFEILNLYDSVDHSSIYQISISNREKVLSELGPNIFADQQRVESLPEGKYFIRLSYSALKPILVFIPVDRSGNITPLCITASDSSHYRFRLRKP